MIRMQLNTIDHFLGHQKSVLGGSFYFNGNQLLQIQWLIPFFPWVTARRSPDFTRHNKLVDGDIAKAAKMDLKQ